MQILKNLPNILTIVRFILIPFIMYFILKENYLIGIILLLISSITDILDGKIARKYNLISTFGKLMDPLADKLVLIGTLLALTHMKVISPIFVILVIIKELIMILGAIFLYKKDIVVQSNIYGKLATVIFYIAIVISMLEKAYTNIFRYNTSTYVLGIAIFITLLALAIYAKNFITLKKNTKEVSH